MPNPKLETYKNKATGTVYDYTDAVAQASIAAIEEKIPDVASSENQLVTEAGLNNVLNFKEDKVPGKGLSTNDYDDTEKAKVAGAFPRSEQAVLGAKNLLDIIATSSGNFTVNSDKTITVNGTFNERTVFYLRTKQTNFVLNKGTYTVSIADIASVIKCVVDAYNGDTWVKNLATTTTKADFSVDYNGYDRIVVYLLIDTADIPATINNVKLSPMIRLATDTDSTYAPYAMTNKELTEKVETEKLSIEPATGITLTSDTKVFKKGDLVHVNFNIESISLSADTTTDVFTIESKGRPTLGTCWGTMIDVSDGSIIRSSVSTNGKFQLRSKTAKTSHNILGSMSYIIE